MGTPAAVQGDKITGTCPAHMIPSASGAPQPAGPLGFSAPLTQGLARTVFIGGKPAAVAGSSGRNSPAHVGLHATDQHAQPGRQVGRVVRGSATVVIEGKAAAMTGAVCTCCASPGQLAGSARAVLIGGGPA